MTTKPAAHNNNMNPFEPGKKISGTYSGLPFYGVVTAPCGFPMHRVELTMPMVDNRLPCEHGFLCNEERTKYYLSFPSNWQDRPVIVDNEYTERPVNKHFARAV